jgi:hypothetical protein
MPYGVRFTDIGHTEHSDQATFRRTNYRDGDEDDDASECEPLVSAPAVCERRHRGFTDRLISVRDRAAAPDFQVAMATYRSAVARWPPANEPIGRQIFQRECRRLLAARRRRKEMAARTAYPRINPITSPIARTTVGSTVAIPAKAYTCSPGSDPQRRWLSSAPDCSICGGGRALMSLC